MKNHGNQHGRRRSSRTAPPVILAVISVMMILLGFFLMHQIPGNAQRNSAENLQAAAEQREDTASGQTEKDEAAIPSLSSRMDTVFFSAPAGAADSGKPVSTQRQKEPERALYRTLICFLILCALIFLAALLLAVIRNAKARAKLDISTMEAELDHAYFASQAKSDFLSNMSHELRTPMNAIVGITTLAKRSVGDEQKTLEYLHKLEISSNYMLSLINDILDMSRIERGKIVLYRIVFDLYEVTEAVDAMIRQISGEKGQHFHVRIDVTHNWIVCDKARFQQIIVNMLNNAVKYTERGGEIRLTIEERGVSGGKVRLYVEVADTGIGIRQEDQKRIFEPFEEASDKDVSGVSGACGTGLGLSISQNLLHMMDSEMQVLSVPGEGSVFFFEIDLEYEEEGESLLMSTANGGWNLQGRHILVAEDNDMNRDMLIDLLCEEHMTCDPARNGEEAVNLFLQSSPGTYDAILMDIRMPKMDGLQATERIRNSAHEDAEKIPVIAMTAYAFTEDIERSMESGMSAYATKPVDIVELCKLLNQSITTGEKGGKKHF